MHSFSGAGVSHVQYMGTTFLCIYNNLYGPISQEMLRMRGGGGDSVNREIRGNKPRVI